VRPLRALPLTLLIDEINHSPPVMLGDPQTITYKLAKPARDI
jgi:hypothetical protein